jgi:hypothetical protein
MTKRKMAWSYSPAKATKPKISATIKAEVEKQAQALIDTVLKPKHIQPAPPDAQFNYIVDITCKWHGSYFYFISKYACPGPHAIAPFFEDRFARLECLDGQEHFRLAYKRYTEQWFVIYPDLSLSQCLGAIKNDPSFHP